MDYSLITSIAALFVALLATYLSIRTIRYQILTLLNSQLSVKAKECNKNLDSSNLSKIPQQIDKISGILSSIITAEEILNYQFVVKRNRFLCKSDWCPLVDQFYLQIHTTIRGYLEQEGINTTNPIINQQFERSKNFLLISICRNKRKYFEVLHQYSKKRVKKLINDDNRHIT